MKPKPKLSKLTRLEKALCTVHKDYIILYTGTTVYKSPMMRKGEYRALDTNIIVSNEDFEQIKKVLNG